MHTGKYDCIYVIQFDFPKKLRVSEVALLMNRSEGKVCLRTLPSKRPLNAVRSALYAQNVDASVGLPQYVQSV
jgi:hypothetical protein